MKKILVIFAVLALIAGTAYAASLNDGLTRQVYAQSTGRSVVSDKSVLFRLWYKGTGNGQVAVSQSTVNLYDDGALTAVSLTTYHTPKLAADYVDGLTNWGAAVGPDARPGYEFAVTAGGTKIPQTVDVATAGASKESPTYVYLDTSTASEFMAGIEATENKINRLKSITARYNHGTTGVVTHLVYDGDTLIWRKDISAGQYLSPTAVDASGNTIKFTDDGEDGLAASMGNSLVVVVSASTTTAVEDRDYPLDSDYLSDHNMSIVYDQF